MPPMSALLAAPRAPDSRGERRDPPPASSCAATCPYCSATAVSSSRLSMGLYDSDEVYDSACNGSYTMSSANSKIGTCTHSMPLIASARLASYRHHVRDSAAAVLSSSSTTDEHWERAASTAVRRGVVSAGGGCGLEKQSSHTKVVAKI